MVLRDYPSLHSPAIPSQTRSEKNMPRLPVRSLPFYKEDDLSSGASVTLNIMSDKVQGLGKRARGALIENVPGAGYTGTLNVEIFNGDDWSENIPLALGASVNYKYEDYIFVELVKITASIGLIHYKVNAVPGVPEDWELEEMGIELQGGE